MPRIVTHLAVGNDGGTLAFSHLAGETWSAEEVARMLLMQLPQTQDIGTTGLVQLKQLGYSILSVRAHEAGR